jgi:molybdopterin converting factor small subunit
MSRGSIAVLAELRGKAQIETGRKQERVELNQDATILGLLDVLQTRLGWPFKEKFVDPETGDLTKNVIILVNGLPVRGKMKSTLLKDGDRVVFFPHSACG